jgi:hypothetical protein
VSDEMKLMCGLLLFALICFGTLLFSEQQSKSYRANCIVAMKDRPATDILAVCK